jgi:Putative prokaryotic signal transducing protein
MSEEVIVIRVFHNEIDAIMAQQELEASGVRAFVFKDDAGGMEPHLQRTSGVRLVVNHADAERAAEILGP